MAKIAKWSRVTDPPFGVKAAWEHDENGATVRIRENILSNDYIVKLDGQTVLFETGTLDEAYDKTTDWLREHSDTSRFKVPVAAYGNVVLLAEELDKEALQREAENHAASYPNETFVSYMTDQSDVIEELDDET